MLKREITYTDFNDQEVTETLYFNLSKPELLELEVEQKGGLANWLRSVVEADDNKTLMEKFKQIVLLAYGQKSPDGKRFIKSDELRLEFEQSIPYEIIFMELVEDDEAAAKFLMGALPKDLAGQVNDAMAATPDSPPTTPSQTA